MAMYWAIFQNGQKISKNFPHKEQAMVEAIERGLVLISKNERWLHEDVQIKEFEEIKTPTTGDIIYSSKSGEGTIDSILAGVIMIVSLDKGLFIDHVRSAKVKWNDDLERWEF